MVGSANLLPTRSELEVLKILQRKPAGAYGLEIVAESNGATKRSSIYVLLGRLEEKGFVRVKKTTSTHPGLPRPIYIITAEGVRAVDACELAVVVMRGSICGQQRGKAPV